MIENHNNSPTTNLCRNKQRASNDPSYYCGSPGGVHPQAKAAPERRANLPLDPPSIELAQRWPPKCYPSVPTDSPGEDFEVFDVFEAPDFTEAVSSMPSGAAPPAWGVSATSPASPQGAAASSFAAALRQSPGNRGPRQAPEALPGLATRNTDASFAGEAPKRTARFAETGADAGDAGAAAAVGLAAGGCAGAAGGSAGGTDSAASDDVKASEWERWGGGGGVLLRFDPGVHQPSNRPAKQPSNQLANQPIDHTHKQTDKQKRIN